MIHQKNEERKEIVQAIYDEAKTMVDPSLSAQVLAKEGWNPGVLGIVAGRLLEELHQPVVVLSIEDGLQVDQSLLLQIEQPSRYFCCLAR